MEICLLVYLLTPDLSNTNSDPAPAPNPSHTLPRNKPHVFLPPVFFGECFFPPTRSWGRTRGKVWESDLVWILTLPFFSCVVLSRLVKPSKSISSSVTFGQRAVENIYTALTHCPGHREEAPAKGCFPSDCDLPSKLNQPHLLSSYSLTLPALTCRVLKPV